MVSQYINIYSYNIYEWLLIFQIGYPNIYVFRMEKYYSDIYVYNYTKMYFLHLSL